MEHLDRAYKCGDRIIHVYLDEDGGGCDPRDRTCVSVMWFFHRGRHSGLGDPKHVTADDFEGWEDMQRALREDYDALFITPVSMYEHGGRSLSLGVTHGWDSGQLGYMWTTKERLAETVGADATEAVVREAYEAELKEYNCWIEGDCWGFQRVEDGQERNEGGCWGFLGNDDKESGLLHEAFGADWEKAVEVRAVAHVSTVWSHE